MKSIIALVLACAMILSGCARSISSSTNTEKTDNYAVTETENITMKKQSDKHVTDCEETISETMPLEFKKIVPEYDNLDDPNLLRYVEDNVYSQLVTELNDNKYFVENVSAVYVSNEYLEELEYNSRRNIYFGYTLEELDEQFQGTRYVFTLGENGETIVEPFEEYDDIYQKVIKNVAIGTGVILVCVTVSVITSGAGAPAISMIFAASAKTGATFALSSGALSGVAATIVTGVQTHDMEQALKAGTLAGSESFKWGAITGTIEGGATEGVKYAKAITTLKGTTLKGLTTQQAAAMQMESGFPVSIIKQFHSFEEYEVYKKAGLVSKMVDGKLALVRDIDLKFKTELSGKTVTNLERMAKGYAPIDPLTGKAYQLHHIGQKADATLAVLTEAEHQGNYTILNMIGKESEIERKAFASIRKAFWKSFAESVM